jgi:hypothetical protein
VLQLYDYRKYIVFAGASVLISVNIIWSFYFQHAYREDTYEVADLTKKLIARGYFEKDEVIYFEPDQGYYDIYPLQVISNNPSIFTSDTIPTEKEIPEKNRRRTA